MKVVIDDKIPFIKGALEKYAEVIYREGDKISRNDLVDAEALIVRTSTKCNAALLDGTQVRFIATATSGFDHIDTEYCRTKNITWTNAEGCNSSSVQQYIAACLCFITEKFKLSFADTTIGIIGVGNIGKKVAYLCEILGMKVLLNDPPRERLEGSKSFVPLETIITDADIITLHVPLNHKGRDKTYHLIDENIFSQINQQQILINTSRGEVVETRAIKSVLQKNKLRGCILDVWEGEPVIDLDLLGMIDIGTPHIAGYSADGKAAGTAMIVKSFCKYFGFDAQDLSPEEIPEPDNRIKEINCKEKNLQRVFCEVVRSTYDILEDDQRLRSSPRTFEKQRAEYPLRREFGAYTINLLNEDKEIESAFRKLDLNVL